MTKKKDKIKAETNRIISKISQLIDLDEILGKEIVISYDDILPDLYIKIPINRETILKYDLKLLKDVDIPFVLYDIYADQIKKVSIRFPNGENKIYNTYYEEDGLDDEFYSCNWQVPMMDIDFNGIEVGVSILELISKGAKVFIEEYEL